MTDLEIAAETFASAGRLSSHRPRLSRDLLAVALTTAAEMLEATGERGTQSAIVLLGQMVDELGEVRARERIGAETIETERRAARVVDGVVIKDRGTAPVCETCGDTHRMTLGDRVVPCTRCPTPYQACRADAYCAETPCLCGCHRRDPA